GTSSTARTPPTSSRAGARAERAPRDFGGEPAPPGRQGPPPLRPEILALHAPLSGAWPRPQSNRGRRAPALRRGAHGGLHRGRAGAPIVEGVARQYGHERPAVEREVMTFLQTMADRGLVQAVA